MNKKPNAAGINNAEYKRYEDEHEQYLSTVRKMCREGASITETVIFAVRNVPTLPSPLSLGNEVPLAYERKSGYGVESICMFLLLVAAYIFS